MNKKRFTTEDTEDTEVLIGCTVGLDRGSTMLHPVLLCYDKLVGAGVLLRLNTQIKKKTSVSSVSSVVNLIQNYFKTNISNY